MGGGSGIEKAAAMFNGLGRASDLLFGLYFSYCIFVQRIIAAAPKNKENKSELKIFLSLITKNKTLERQHSFLVFTFANSPK